jgi:hypothetical protein
MGILLSDDCAAPATPHNANIDETPEGHYQELEDQVQDGLDDLAVDGDESALLEMDKTRRSQFLRRFLRGVGVFFLVLFVALACVSAAAAIGIFLGMALALFMRDVLKIAFRHRDGFLGVLGYGFRGGVLGAAIGLPACMHELYTNLLPRLQ